MILYITDDIIIIIII